jgi:hypothetical protein
MKITARFRIITLLVVLAVTILFCVLSVRFHRATYDRSIFEDCERPITFGRLTELALFGNHSSYNACINNLRQLDGAKVQWALENNKPTNAIPTWKDVMPYMSRGGTYRPWCPQGGVYRLGGLTEFPSCSMPAHKLN